VKSVNVVYDDGGYDDGASYSFDGVKTMKRRTIFHYCAASSATIAQLVKRNKPYHTMKMVYMMVVAVR